MQRPLGPVEFSNLRSPGTGRLLIEVRHRVYLGGFWLLHYLKR